MSKGDPVPSLPTDAPQVGEVYRHYKGDLYKVVGLALHSTTDEWMVVYEPTYDAAVHLFTRPLKEWHEMVEWEGSRGSRFIKQ